MNAPETSSPHSVNVRPDGVAVLTYDIPGEPVNTLRADFIDIFARAFEQIDKHPDVRAAVFISGKKDSFIAGADVKMLESVATAEAARAIVQRGHDAMAKLAASTKPIVAAVHGAALGGGFEVALACHARVLSNAKSTVLGLPEVQLGLLPGLSGLQRLAALQRHLQRQAARAAHAAHGAAAAELQLQFAKAGWPRAFVHRERLVHRRRHAAQVAAGCPAG